jgi:UDP-N-acetylmuramoyl-L-alanyl-D-glutamate--2,6-diaminopimelate ligase
LDIHEVIKDVARVETRGSLAGDVSSIQYDSRLCREGSLFVAVPGLKLDGHAFIPQAVAAGARFVVCERFVDAPPGAAMIRVENARRALGLLGRNFYGDPSAGLCLVGVTGTNGKTTITYLLESIFEAAGFRAGVVGTINYRYAGEKLPAPNTTPESLDLQRILREMAARGVTHVVMEVSSHALDMGRVEYCRFQAGVFTNLTRDHLDYHRTMEEYYHAKKRFFAEVLSHDPGIHRIVNIDDPWGKRLIGESGASAASYGIDTPADFTTDEVELSIRGIHAKICTPRAGRIPVRSPLIGRFNLYNILAAAAAARLLGIPPNAVREGIERLRNVPGRMERISRPGEPAVFVDYAHTEDALKRVLQNLVEFRKNRIITVFGCGGDRDRGKRPLMGKAAVSYSDLTILTSDNPRSEDPLVIIEEIEKGIDSVRRHPPRDLDLLKGRAYTVIPDRVSAIEAAIRAARSTDIVLIAGKGHEDYQIVGGRVLPFDDRRIGRQVLDARADAAGIAGEGG